MRLLFSFKRRISTKDIENAWKYQWKGPIIFAHGSNRSCGVLILVKESLEFDLRVSDRVIQAKQKKNVGRRGLADLRHIYVAYRSYPTSNHGNIFFVD